MKVIYVDGSCRNNQALDQSQRKMATCFVDDQIINHAEFRISLPKQEIKLPSGTRVVGQSNNIAELLAILEAMRYAIDRTIDRETFKVGYKELLIKTDSQTAYWWITRGNVKNNINDPEYVHYLLGRINKMKPWFDKFEIEVVPREINKAGIALEAFIKRNKDI